jgi:regulator of sirC expression with transglutaminase-like and TPR domain
VTTPNEIASLIYLLEDPDPDVRREVEDRFRQLGDRAVPILDEQRSLSDSKEEIAAIEAVLANLTFDGLFSDYMDQLDRGLDDIEQLEALLLVLARIGNPTLNSSEYRKKLDRIAVDIAGQIFSEPSESRRLRIFLHYMFRELRFSGDHQRYHHPDNGLLDRVIDRRKGLPLMLSLVALFLGNRLRLPFFGINMPIHFMLLYKGEHEQKLIDPFDGGRVITYDQCQHFLKQNGITPRAHHFEIATPVEILTRSIRNLIHSYSMLEDEVKVQQLRVLLKSTEERFPSNT